LTASGAACCWGAGFYATLGLGPEWNDAVCGAGQQSYCPRPAPVAGNLTFATLAAGDNTTCGVTTSGRALCWGLNLNGALGIGTSDGPESCPPADAFDPPSLPCSLVPTPVAGGLTFQTGRDQLAFGCALPADGAAHCWGDNAQFRLGSWAGMQQCTYTGPFSGTITSPCATAPIVVASGLRFKSIYSGVGYSCGLTVEGEAYCWGSNGDGELGNGTVGPETCGVFGVSRGCSLTPRPVVGGHRFASLAINETTEWRHHTCGVTEACEVYCWGANDEGKLGTGTTMASPRPVRIAAVQ
jgi:alpha-tubulin suppressor-like RCC1 family protein